MKAQSSRAAGISGIKMLCIIGIILEFATLVICSDILYDIIEGNTKVFVAMSLVDISCVVSSIAMARVLRNKI